MHRLASDPRGVRGKMCNGCAVIEGEYLRVGGVVGKTALNPWMTNSLILKYSVLLCDPFAVNETKPGKKEKKEKDFIFSIP